MRRMDVNVKRELGQVLTALNMGVLVGTKEEIAEGLVRTIGRQSVVEIFDNQNIDELENLEIRKQKAVFNKLYAFSKKETLNPFRIFLWEITEGFYNESFKVTFIESMINEYTEESIKNIAIIFDRTASVEEKLGKDLYDFDTDELTEAFVALKSKTVRSLQNYVSKIKQYVDFALKQGVTAYNFNHATSYNTQKKIEKYVDEEANMIFDMEEIMDMAEYSDNAQDGVILALTFDGVSFKDNYTELVELTEKQVDFENSVINLPERTEGDRKVEARTVPMSAKTRMLVKRAIEDGEYVSITGEKSRTYKLAESNHILRGVRKGREKINWRNINQRILRIADVEAKENLNATTISYSGQVYYAYQLIRNGMNTDKAVDMILNRFGLAVNTSSRFYLKNRIEQYINNLA
ncbi:phage lytic cycle repressor MrpR family protein [Bacillus gaemokensis]|uniref:Integrase n=1 Tax=Bacillus gaemokensis TaxID=574375 RepID=A0A073KBN9_9BACI|nr:tyrosine-type recombinase/integrase [Bacillus gaemokensis]KEK23872.1 hypothetical protein BAGA_05365 [Bacillus gaemokensis]KYG38113.1 hypothetical protein AZF08_20400 [Bacillus gaemokensis]